GLFLLRFPFEVLYRQPAPSAPDIMKTPIYISKAQLEKALPSILPPGPGAKPGHGIHPKNPPALGATNLHPKLTIVLSPPRPDNNRQTIIQPNSPPDLRIPQELHLPNIIVGNPLGPAKPKL